jgi:hypothetical protein
MADDPKLRRQIRVHHERAVMYTWSIRTSLVLMATLLVVFFAAQFGRMYVIAPAGDIGMTGTLVCYGIAGCHLIRSFKAGSGKE